MINVQLIQSNFNAKGDAKALRDAMQGLGKTDG